MYYLIMRMAKSADNFEQVKIYPKFVLFNDREGITLSPLRDIFELRNKATVKMKELNKTISILNYRNVS